jgi:DNA polymerase III delta prime subunit
MNAMRPSLLLFASFLGLQLVDVFSHQLITIGSSLKKSFCNYIERRAKAIENNKFITPNPSASIEFYRDYSNSDENQVYIDAILNHLSELNSVIRLQRRKIYLVNSFKPFDITKDIQGRIKNINIKDSYTISLSDIRQWIEGVYDVYKTEMQTGFGKYRYFFNHQSAHMDINISHYLTFDMTKFYTNKSLHNLFGVHINQVRQRLQMFQDNKGWYEDKGIPYTFGLLLHGLPGCGKTSLIKAIAKDTHRHIINIKLTNNVTLTQLRNLFYSEKLKIVSSQATPQYITIPIDQRIYVMEDVDCLTNILNQRGSETEEETLTEEDARNIKMLGKERWRQLKNLNNDSITLADILNIVDGVLETPGRILVLTSNFPDKLDKALLRPGRIDLIINFKECNIDQLTEMFNHFYKQELNFDFSPAIDGVYVPAYVQEILLRHLDDPQAAYDHLVDNVGEYLSQKNSHMREEIASSFDITNPSSDRSEDSFEGTKVLAHKNSYTSDASDTSFESFDKTNIAIIKSKPQQDFNSARGRTILQSIFPENSHKDRLIYDVMNNDELYNDPFVLKHQDNIYLQA